MLLYSTVLDVYITPYADIEVWTAHEIGVHIPLEEDVDAEAFPAYEIEWNEA